jgi:8-oxo-dGTP diphosphatase
MTNFHMTLPFCVAFIKNSKGYVLIGQHPDLKRKPYPLLWDLPGGKLEENETPEECIKREIKEELGYTVIKAQLVDVFHHAGVKIRPECNSNISSIGLCYKVKVKGRMVSTEQNNVHYAAKKELRKLKMTPWTEYFLRKMLSGKSR